MLRVKCARILIRKPEKLWYFTQQIIEEGLVHAQTTEGVP